MVQQYLNKLGEREKPFKDNLPGIDWFKSILLRHRDLTIKLAENTERNKEKVFVSSSDRLGASRCANTEPQPETSFQSSNFVEEQKEQLYPQTSPDMEVEDEQLRRQSTSQISLGKQKATNVIRNGLRPFFNEKLVSELNQHLFSVYIDETTDVSVKKQLAILVSYCHNFETKVDVIDVVDCPDGTAVALYTQMINTLKENNVPLQNWIGFVLTRLQP
ncbi:hypothetical protein JTB14_027566 [Gonioctena quinquepunctata]|nr:hypothetical protein JTB14_027566 [Gonioctena quinquepunctata]